MIFFFISFPWVAWFLSHISQKFVACSPSSNKLCCQIQASNATICTISQASEGASNHSLKQFPFFSQTPSHPIPLNLPNFMDHLGYIICCCLVMYIYVSQYGHHLLWWSLLEPLLISRTYHKSTELPETHQWNLNLNMNISFQECASKMLSEILAAIYFEPNMTHWGGEKKADIFQMTFSNAFSWMKRFEFWRHFYWILFLQLQLTIILPSLK